MKFYRGIFYAMAAVLVMWTVVPLSVWLWQCIAKGEMVSMGLLSPLDLIIVAIAGGTGAGFIGRGIEYFNVHNICAYEGEDDAGD